VINLGLLSRVASLLNASGDALGKTHLGGECRMWDPLAGLAGRAFLQHTVNLFKRETLCLRDEKKGKENGDDAEGAPHEEDLG
jgi:hypothetical protein